MTQAYIEGFCKTAEAYGVDPEQLMKVAQTPLRIMKTLRAAKKMPVFGLEETIKSLTDKINAKELAADVQKSVGVLPGLATRKAGRRTKFIRGLLNDVLEVRTGNRPVFSLARWPDAMHRITDFKHHGSTDLMKERFKALIESLPS